MPVQPAPPETDSLAAARDGDQAAFGRLVEPDRRELHAPCYRMLGLPCRCDFAAKTLQGASY